MAGVMMSRALAHARFLTWSAAPQAAPRPTPTVGGSVATAAPATMAPMGLMDYAAISEQTGIKRTVLQKYHSVARKRREAGDVHPGDLPAPDAYFGRTPVWKAETIQSWLAARPGKGVGGGRPARSQS